MKEPALEEEALNARASGRNLEITRQTIGDDPGPATVTYPSGKTQAVQLTQSEPGLYKASIAVGETGLFRVTNGDLSALAHVGAVDAPEFKSEISTTQTLHPMAQATHGVVARLARADGSAEPLPQILAVHGNVRIEGNERMAFRLTNESILKGIDTLPLFDGLIGLAALLLAASAMWWREGR
jgi:hypothetical protein